jgi:hypothetical protein
VRALSPAFSCLGGLGLCLGLLAPAALVHAATPGELQAQCKQQLRSISPDDPAFKRLNAIYRQSLRFGRAPHGVLPGFYASYQDLVAARRKLSDSDIPYIVFELARISKTNSRQRVALGVLAQFGRAALPCIEAAMEDRSIAGIVLLNQVKSSIEVQ